jgi:hypothetical protein
VLLEPLAPVEQPLTCCPCELENFLVRHR